MPVAHFFPLPACWSGFARCAEPMDMLIDAGERMSSKPVVVGNIIDCRCTRCKDLTGHNIVAMVEGEIIKVECRACGSVHKYRAPKQAKSAARVTTVRKRNTEGGSRQEAISAARSAAAKKAAQTRAKQRAEQDAQAVMVAWKTALVTKGSDDARPYNMRESYNKGDVMDHPKFGLGEVQETVKPDKVHVLFEDGVKVLRCVV